MRLSDHRTRSTTRTGGGRRRVSRGWWIVAVFAGTQTAGYGCLYYAFAVLLHPIATDLRTGPAAVTGALTIAVLASAAAAIRCRYATIGQVVVKERPRGRMPCAGSQLPPSSRPPGSARRAGSGRVAEPAAIVDACTLHGRGGSPTAVFDDDDPGRTDDDRRDLVRRAGTSHGAFLDGDAVRFFTARQELVNCGHGTVAAQAVLLRRRGVAEHDGAQRTGGRLVATTAAERAAGIEVWYDQGVIDLRPPGELGEIVAAIGLAPQDVGAGACVASPGTARLLLPVHLPQTLHELRPDLERLGTECRRLGLLGCFVYAPTAGGAVARMFAPAIGVGEDVVNANSAGCLAAAFLAAGRTGLIEVHQGAALGRPSLVLATAAATAGGITTRVGGVAVISGRSGSTPAAA